MEYYRITTEDVDDTAEELFGSDKKELTKHTEPSHSLFGILFNIQKETGWTHKYLLWGEPWFTIQLKLADLPRITDSDKPKEIEGDDELSEFLLK